MDVLILLVFVSLVLVAGALLFLLTRLKGGDFEHVDRLPLLPLEPDGPDPLPPERPVRSAPLPAGFQVTRQPTAAPPRPGDARPDSAHPPQGRSHA